MCFLTYKTIATSAMEEAGTQPVARTTQTVNTTQTATENDTVNVMQDAVAGSRMAAITSMWDSLAIPVQPPGLELSAAAKCYIEQLSDAISEQQTRANQFEGAAQALAEANVRQTKIIAKLRTDVTRLKLKLMNTELQAEAKFQGLPDHES